MAQLNFPDTPIDGQLYPNPCPVGVTQYRWDTATGMWRIVGVATGVTPGTYGNDITVGQFTADVQGRISYAANIPIRQSGEGITGIVALESSLNSISQTEALSALGGKRLQDQIGNLDACTVPNHVNVVDALNDLQRQSKQLQEGAMIWCGYYNAQEGTISYVSIAGARLGYNIGDELPDASFSNGGDFFVVTYPGNPYIAGDYNAPNEFCYNGDWLISEVSKWQKVDAAGELIASAVRFTPVGPLTATNVQSALTQVTQLFRTGIGGATISELKPNNPYPGQLWWDSNDGLFYVFYSDINGSQWVEAGGGGSQSLQGGGGIQEIRTGVGLTGGPITSDGEISLIPAFWNSVQPLQSTIGGVIPRIGFKYNNTTGFLDLNITSDFTGRAPQVSFSQEGANLLNAKIEALSGSSVLAGTYNASTGSLVYVTPLAESRGFVVGNNLPIPSPEIDGYYVIVVEGGDIGPEDQPITSKSGDWFICEASGVPAVWVLIDYNQGTIAASNVAVTPIPGIEFAGTAQTALQAVETQAQDRVQFVVSESESLSVTLTEPAEGFEGTSLTLNVSEASLSERGVVQLTSDIQGDSESLAVTQYAVNLLDSKVESLSGSTILAGTYNCASGLVVQPTIAGAAKNFIAGAQAPLASDVPDGYYLIVTQGGGFGPPDAVIPQTGVQAGDWFITQNSTWVLIDYDNRDTAAEAVSLSFIPGLTATNVQDGIAQLQEEVEGCYTQLLAGSGITVETDPTLAETGLSARVSLKLATPYETGGVLVPPLNGLQVDSSGALTAAKATTSSLGSIIVGDNLTVDGNGRLSVVAPGLTTTDIQELDDLSSQFDAERSTFTLQSGGQNLPLNLTAEAFFIYLDGVLQRPIRDYIYDEQNSFITFTFEPAPGTQFMGRALVAIPPLSGSILPGVTSITFEGPLTGGTITGGGSVGIVAATSTQRGTMSAADKAKMDEVGSNGFGNKTISTELPSGGNDGDIWYVI